MSFDEHVRVGILEEIPFLNEDVCYLYLPAGFSFCQYYQVVRNSEVSAKREYSGILTYPLIGFQNMTSLVN